MKIKLKSIIGIFTVIDSELYLISDNKSLICIECDDDIDAVNKKYIKENLSIPDVNLKQCYTFCEKDSYGMNISILYIDIVPYNNIINKKLNFISLNNIDIDIYMKKMIDYLKKDIVMYSTMIKLYPNEFSLPEIQNLYEKILKKQFDRRNFRKKLLKSNIIEDLCKIGTFSKGRPAKLYKFKIIDEDQVLI